MCCNGERVLGETRDGGEEDRRGEDIRSRWDSRFVSPSRALVLINLKPGHSAPWNCSLAIQVTVVERERGGGWNASERLAEHWVVWAPPRH